MCLILPLAQVSSEKINSVSTGLYFVTMLRFQSHFRSGGQEAGTGMLSPCDRGGFNQAAIAKTRVKSGSGDT